MSNSKNFGISQFIEESSKYTKENFDEMNIKEIFSSAITGRVGNTNLFNSILNVFGKELKSTISTLRNYINHHYYT